MIFLPYMKYRRKIISFGLIIQCLDTSIELLRTDEAGRSCSLFDRKEMQHESSGLQRRLTSSHCVHEQLAETRVKTATVGRKCKCQDQICAL